MEKEFSCENCKYISVTEIEQRLLYNKSEMKELVPHECTFYNEHLEHFTTSHNKTIIFPCISCVRAQYENYTLREEENKDD